MMQKIVFFSPYAYIWKHSVAELRLSKLLASNNFEVEIVGCDSAMDHFCTPMSYAKMKIDDNSRKMICESCVRSRKLALLNRKLTLELIKIQTLKSEISNLTIQAKIDFKILDIEIGKIAAYETLINFKKTDFNFSEEELKYYEAALTNCINVFEWAIQYLSDKKPSAVVVYSPQYGAPGAFAAAAVHLGIKVTFIEGSSDDNQRYTHLRMWNWEKYGLNQPAFDHLENFSNFELTKQREKTALNTLKAKRSYKTLSVYSTDPQGINPFLYFKLDPKKKTILLTMSSYDEVFSGVSIRKLPPERFRSQVYENQIEWLIDILDWVKNQPDLQIIVRPHPREFPNKRDGVKALHSEIWERVLVDLPANVRVDKPELKFSLHDYWGHVNVVTTGWSSTGIEALSFGLPVVTYDEKISIIPKGIHFSGTSRQEYYKNLLLAAKSQDFEMNKLNALRWLSFLSEKGSVKIGGGVQTLTNRPALSVLNRFLYLRGMNFISRIVDSIRPVKTSDEKIIVKYFRNSHDSLFEIK
jgi:hypothetical protein